MPDQHRMIKAIIRGKVQGVWFRRSTQEKAISLNLSGWVRNLTNGDVEVVAWGDNASIDALEQWLGCGPEQARVDSVAIDNPSQSIPKTATPFEIR